MTKKHFTVTTPCYYVNAAPHLGTAYTTIAADVISRFQRMNGKEVSLVTGLDEHGQKVAETAEKNGMTPQEWCDSLAPAFLDTWKMLDISYTDFIRTSSSRQEKTVQEFWNKLFDKGFLYKDSYEGWYCVHEETYYAESDLEKNEDGEFVCPDCKRPVVKSSGEENWFFKLSDFQDDLLKFYDENPDFIQPVSRRNEIVSFVSRGLKDLSISRSTFDWGVPFLFDEGHVAYVWADALLFYLTGTGYGDPSREQEFVESWPADFQFVGKDITRFHCVIWPAMLMAAEMEIPKCVFGHGFLLTKGEKMSKSKGNALSPADLVDIFGVDAYRYYFMSDVQFGSDGSISIERMCQVYNADLANTWGNLVSRVTNMTSKYFDGKVPEHTENFKDNPLFDLSKKLYKIYDEAMEKVDFTGAAAAVMELAHAANLYVENSQPWNLAKDEEKRGELADVLYNALEAIRIIALYMSPFCTRTSEDVLSRIGYKTLGDIEYVDTETEWGLLESGKDITVGEPLFPRLDESKIEVLDN